MKFKHFILTKFNLRIHHTKDDANLGGEWLDHRFEIFNRFCYPSVMNQTCTDFEWLVLFDERTETKYKTSIAQYSGFIPVFVKGIQRIRDIVKDHVKEPIDHLITSRLDNDDALSQSYIECIQQQFTEQKFEFINLDNGCQYHSGQPHAYTHNRNPFISLIEKYDGFKTVWCCTHGEIHQMGSVKQVITPKPQWMVVIHEKNALNRIATRDKINIDLLKEFGVK